MGISARPLVFAAVVALAPSAASAQAVEARNVASVSPLLGLLGFGRLNVGAWAINYERRVGDHLGVLVEGSGVHVHGSPMHVWLFGGTVALRWHFAAAGSSPFVGVHAGYRAGFGRNFTVYDDNGAARPASDDGLSIGQVLVVANVGYRWAHRSGLTVTGRLGAGYGPIAVTGSGPAAVARETGDVLGFTALAVDAELSVGYRF